METIRHISIVKFFWLFLTFLIFNYSIDAPDYYCDGVAEDLSYNDIESISELVLEVFLGIENAVPEHDEDDSDDKSGFSKKIDVPFIQQIFIEEITFLSSIEKDSRGYCICLDFFENPYLSGQIKPPQV